ncbi:MAG: tRNA lysidine(34) synthetase TilS [Proteobacteria bacterium]|nr:tRNA lysidine(34) synthetase TilS [Pseudomonadota bacterium]
MIEIFIVHDAATAPPPLPRQAGRANTAVGKGVDNHNKVMFGLLPTVEAAARRADMAGKGVLVAVSGGGDSMALLELLLELADKCDLKLEVAFVDHGCREDVQSELELVEARALAAGLPFFCLRVKAGTEANEARLRELRYSALFGCADERGLQLVATGHNSDDQSETILMNLFRGGGLRALGGMRGARGRVVRPLLDIRRSALRELLESRGVVWAEDPSNNSDRFLRNRIRGRVLPIVEREVGEHVARRLAEDASRLRLEDDYLQDEASRYRLWIAGSGTDAVLDLAAFDRVPPALRWRVLRSWLLETGGPRSPTARQLDLLEKLAGRRDGSAELDIPGRPVLREYGQLRRVLMPVNPLDFNFVLDPGCDAAVEDPAGKWTITVDQMAAEPLRKSILEQAVTASRGHLLRADLAVRPHRTGDRIRLATGGHALVSDLLGELKVPRAMREGWPVLEQASSLLWVPGLLADPDLAAGSSNDSLLLSWKRKPGF